MFARNPGEDLSKRLPQVLLALTACIAPGSAGAVNVLYLPGDAYFPTSLTQEKVEQLRKQRPDERAFDYSSMGGYRFAFCGYAGYGKAVFQGLDGEFFDKLMAVYDDLRNRTPRDLREIKEEDGSVRLIELNSVGVLFYPASCPRSAVLGLRYNENWVEELENLGHARERQRLCCLINDPKAVMLSWRDAKAFPSFQIDQTSLPAQGHPEEQTPLRIRGAIRAVVLGFSTPLELFDVGDDEWCEVHTISAEGIETRRQDYGEVNVLPWRKADGKWTAPSSADWHNLPVDDGQGDRAE